MEIIKLKIEDIIPYANNAKEHTHYHIEQIKDSIERFGFNDPIAVDENNVVIEGHGRLEALKELGYEEVEAIKLTHLTEDQKRTYIIAHNKLTLNSSFDMEILEEELRKIPDDLLSTTGFEDFEISSILGYEEKISEDMDEEPKSSNFAVTLFLPRSKKDIVDDYIDENGTDELAEIVLNHIEKEIRRS